MQSLNLREKKDKKLSLFQVKLDFFYFMASSLLYNFPYNSFKIIGRVAKLMKLFNEVNLYMS